MPGGEKFLIFCLGPLYQDIWSDIFSGLTSLWLVATLSCSANIFKGILMIWMGFIEKTVWGLIDSFLPEQTLYMRSLQETPWAIYLTWSPLEIHFSAFPWLDGAGFIIHWHSAWRDHNPCSVKMIKLLLNFTFWYKIFYLESWASTNFLWNKYNIKSFISCH